MFKKTIQLLIILGILFAIFYYMKHEQRTEKEISFFDIDSTRIAKLEFQSKNEKVTIQKINGRWILSNPIKWEVSSDQIKLFFSKALKVQVTKTPMSEDTKNQDRYKVTPDEAVIVSIYDNKSHLLDRVYVGKSLNSSFCYARRPGSKSIYQLKDNISEAINPSIFMWRSPIIVPVILQNLAKIDVKYVSNSYRFILENQTWYYQDASNKFQLNPRNTYTGKLFNALTSLRTYQFIDNRWNDYEEYFRKPAALVTITDKSGKTVKLTFAIDKENNVFLIKNDDQNTIYQMTLDMLSRFTVAAPHFKN